MSFASGVCGAAASVHASVFVVVSEVVAVVESPDRRRALVLSSVVVASFHIVCNGNFCCLWEFFFECETDNWYTVVVCVKPPSIFHFCLLLKL